VTARASRPALLGILLALVALLGMTGVSGWHSAHVHPDSPTHAAAAADDHGDASRNGLEGTAHLAAHAMGHGFALPQQTAFLRPGLVTVKSWALTRALLLPGLNPAALLRPPRA
jgi:hypothetical protein